MILIERRYITLQRLLNALCLEKRRWKDDTDGRDITETCRLVLKMEMCDERQIRGPDRKRGRWNMCSIWSKHSSLQVYRR
jgi:hypothetical protein